jgi:hypothetical protein
MFTDCEQVVLMNGVMGGCATPRAAAVRGSRPTIPCREVFRKGERKPPADPAGTTERKTTCRG